MKAKLIFDLDNPDDVMSLNRCTKALDMALCLFDIAYNNKEIDTRDDIIDKINKSLETHDINLNKLIE